MRALRFGLLGICMGLAGCGADHRAQCEAKVQCSGGNDKDIDACTAFYDSYRNFYDDLGCVDEYDTYFECTSALMACRSSPTGQSCMVDADCPGSASCKNDECVNSAYSIDPDTKEECAAEATAYAACASF